MIKLRDSKVSIDRFWLAEELAEYINESNNTDITYYKEVEVNSDIIDTYEIEITGKFDKYQHLTIDINQAILIGKDEDFDLAIDDLFIDLIITEYEKLIN